MRLRTIIIALTLSPFSPLPGFSQQSSAESANTVARPEVLILGVYHMASGEDTWSTRNLMMFWHDLDPDVDFEHDPSTLTLRGRIVGEGGARWYARPLLVPEVWLHDPKKLAKEFCYWYVPERARRGQPGL